MRYRGSQRAVRLCRAGVLLPSTLAGERGPKKTLGVSRTRVSRPQPGSRVKGCGVPSSLGVDRVNRFYENSRAYLYSLVAVALEKWKGSGVASGRPSGSQSTPAPGPPGPGSRLPAPRRRLETRAHGRVTSIGVPTGAGEGGGRWWICSWVQPPG